MNTTDKKVSHTPGVWQINDDPMKWHSTDEAYKIIVYAENQKRIALCYKDAKAVYVNEHEAEANAKLIADSPLMFEYIQKLAHAGDTEAQAIINRHA